MHDLSQRSGVPEMTLGKWLRGETSPPYVRVVKLAEALDLSVSVWRDIPWFDADEDVPAERVKVPA